MWNRKQVPHWVPEFHRYSKTINNTHKTHKQHSMPLQYSTFTHIPVYFSKTHSPPDPLSKGQQKVPDHSPNWPGAINQQNTPVLALIPHSYQHPQLPTLTQDSFPLGGSWWPWIPQGPNPPFVHQVLRMQQFAVSLDFPNLHNPDHWHKGSWMMTDPFLPVDFPLLLSLNLLHCRQENVFPRDERIMQLRKLWCRILRLANRLLRIAYVGINSHQNTNVPPQTWKKVIC